MENRQRYGRRQLARRESVPAAARRVVSLTAAAAFAAVAIATVPAPAMAGSPVPLSWANDVGTQADGQIETDQDRQQIFASLTVTGDGAVPTGQKGPSGPA